MTEPKPDYDITDEWEQEAAQMKNVARLMTIYYKELARNGMPIAISRELVQDYHQIFLMTSNQ
jgi:hypothetical protein